MKEENKHWDKERGQLTGIRCSLSLAPDLTLDLKECDIRFLVSTAPTLTLSLKNVEKLEIAKFFLEEPDLTLKWEDVVFTEKIWIWGMSQKYTSIKEKKEFLLLVFRWENNDNELLKYLYKEDYERIEGN